MHPERPRPAAGVLPGPDRFGWSAVWGPPGTGKTYTVGQQVAAALDDPRERVLVVSTTNRSTDRAAVEVGRAVRDRTGEAGLGEIRRIGRGADPDELDAHGLLALLGGADAAVLRRAVAADAAAARAEAPAERAGLRNAANRLRERLPPDRSVFQDPAVRWAWSPRRTARSRCCWSRRRGWRRTAPRSPRW